MPDKSNNEFNAYLGESLLKTLQTKAGALNPIIMDLRNQWIKNEYRYLLEDMKLTSEEAKEIISRKTFYDENNEPYLIGSEAINKIVYKRK